MFLIAPPPVGADSEPNVVLDNTRAVTALRESYLAERRPPAEPRRAGQRLLAVLVVLGAATLLAATVGAAAITGPRSKAWYRLLRRHAKRTAALTLG